MKSLYLIAASTVALGALAAGCAPSRPPVARAALDCPETQGDLTRTAVAADRKSCVYKTSDGSEVTLQLVATGGDPTGTLKAIEANLLAPIEAARVAAAAAGDKAVEASDKSAADEPADEAAGEAAKAAAEAARDATKDAAGARRDVNVDVDVDKGEDVHVNLPGLRVEAREGADGTDTAHVKMPFLEVHANDATDEADIRVGGMHIKAKDDAAEIRMYRDVRLKGEALSPEKRGLRATFIYTGKRMPEGYRFVGYEAAGPKMGPITVATVRSNSSDESIHNDSVYKDVKRLVRRNAGV